MQQDDLNRLELWVPWARLCGERNQIQWPVALREQLVISRSSSRIVTSLPDSHG
jgi:hypothetical protein